MDIAKIYENPKQFQTITGLTTDEFATLLGPFTHRWQQWYKHHDFGMRRRRKPLSARAYQNNTRTLPTVIDKLFFILYVYKNNPLQQTSAATFHMDQGQVSKWVKILPSILEEALKDLGLQPARDADGLARSFRYGSQSVQDQDEIQTLNLDVTERPIGRSTDHQTQRHDYSGKQKQHTVKNSVLCDRRPGDEYRYIHFLGDTWRGAIHDKKMADYELPHFQMEGLDQLWLAKDTAYESYCPEGITLLEPFRARRNKPLTQLQKKINTWVSSVRIVVEHAIGGLKRLRIVSEKWRSRVDGRLDQAINIAAGLHNLRTVMRRTSYQGATSRKRARLEIFRS